MAQKIQSLIFDKEKWTLTEAKDWLAGHDFKSGGADETEDTFRFRQFDPGMCEEGSFVTLTENFPDGISAIACDTGEDSMRYSGLPKGVEIRRFPLKELRVEEPQGSPRIAGHAAVFDVLSEEMWGFREIVRKGAFATSLREDDIRSLWNHDPNFVLGRNKSGTLALEEDKVGLAIAISPPDTVISRHFLEGIRRGDVDQMSFGFMVRMNGEKWADTTDGVVRELLNVRLFDVSPVTFPAYPQTTITVRSRFSGKRRPCYCEQCRQSRRSQSDADFSLVKLRLDLADRT